MKTRYWVILTFILSLFNFTAFADNKETEQTSDAWLKAKIVTTYALSEHLNPFLINVDVTGGVVTLTGKVENAIESDLAGELAKGVKGVREVNNKLIIDIKAQRDKEQGSFLHYVEDANITARVKSRLLLNPNTNGLQIHATTKNGVVFLEGKLKSEIEADLARQIVRNTEGVIDIADHLTVTDNQSSKE